MLFISCTHFNFVHWNFECQTMVWTKYSVYNQPSVVHWKYDERIIFWNVEKKPVGPRYVENVQTTYIILCRRKTSLIVSGLPPAGVNHMDRLLIRRLRHCISTCRIPEFFHFQGWRWRTDKVSENYLNIRSLFSIKVRHQPDINRFSFHFFFVYEPDHWMD